MLNDKVLPFYDEQGVDLLRVLTDRGTEYCGKLENHAYQIYLDIEDINQTKTKAYSPQTNGICERFHKTMKNECYDIIFRKKVYSSLEEIQADIDTWLEHYNNDRTHSGKHCYGKTPMKTWNDSKQLAKSKNLGNIFEKSDTISTENNSN